ncbi:hypothetical protein [Corynebacterium cystitidis]|uniref:hypothetical protein n=1 Tax=Corynebacterium cystitidis TaxID=35757 RepID=UPI00211E1081|nr:hypothetical protein [Corynebacterium cystitidis]
MSLTPKQCIDIVEAVLGERKALLSPREFAQITGRDSTEVWRDCVNGTIPATQTAGVKGRWKIPATGLRRYFTKAAA